jgi:hypothetical protein
MAWGDEDPEDGWNKPKDPPDGWDEELPDEWNYEKPPDVPLNKPQGFWGNGGNPWWSGPPPGVGFRWGDDPTGGYDPRTGMPDADDPQVEHAGFHPWVQRQESKVDDVIKKYRKVRHPGRTLRRKIEKDLRSRIPKAETKKIMRNQNWL